MPSQTTQTPEEITEKIALETLGIRSPTPLLRRALLQAFEAGQAFELGRSEISRVAEEVEDEDDDSGDFDSLGDELRKIAAESPPTKEEG